MGWETELEGIRINGSRGDVWPCSPTQASAIAWRLDSMFADILECDPKDQDARPFVRSMVRIPFLNALFAGACYGEYFHRKEAIGSARDLTKGEAHAVLNFLSNDLLAGEVLAAWAEEWVAAIMGDDIGSAA